MFEHASKGLFTKVYLIMLDQLAFYVPVVE